MSEAPLSVSEEFVAAADLAHALLGTASPLQATPDVRAGYGNLGRIHFSGATTTFDSIAHWATVSWAGQPVSCYRRTVIESRPPSG
jgi:hypothetical protein